MTKLFCWIWRDASAFAIDISPEQTISDLKMLIPTRNPNAFQGIDDHQLKLFKKITPFKDKENIQQEDLKDLMVDVDTVGEYLEQPLQPKSIHVIVFEVSLAYLLTVVVKAPPPGK